MKENLAMAWIDCNRIDCKRVLQILTRGEKINVYAGNLELGEVDIKQDILRRFFIFFSFCSAIEYFKLDFKNDQGSLRGIRK